MSPPSVSRTCELTCPGDASTEVAVLQASIGEMQTRLKQELELKVSALRLQLAAELAAYLDSRLATAVAHEQTKDANSDKPKEDRATFELRTELEALSRHLEEAVTRLGVLELRRELEQRARCGLLATVAVPSTLEPSPPTLRYNEHGQKGFKEHLGKGSLPSPQNGLYEVKFPETGRKPTRIDNWVHSARGRSKSVGQIHAQDPATHLLIPRSFEALEPPLEPLRCLDDGSEPDLNMAIQFCKPSGAGAARDGNGSAWASFVWQRSFGAEPGSLEAFEDVQMPEVFQESPSQLPPTPSLRHSFISACKPPPPSTGRMRVTKAGALVVGVDV